MTREHWILIGVIVGTIVLFPLLATILPLFTENDRHGG